MDNFSVVFSRATGNADNYRIPSVVCTKDGTLVAACDERFFTAADNPNRIDKVVRISTDGGKSWSEQITAVKMVIVSISRSSRSRISPNNHFN